MVRPVYIYADEGTSEVGVHSLQVAVEEQLHLPTKVIKAPDIIAGKLAHCQMLIIPGGADRPYCAKLNGLGNQQIQQFVQDGGFYLGICAGAYYATKQIEFTGKDYSVFEQRELAFFDGIAVGSLPDLTNQQYYGETADSKAFTTLTFDDDNQSAFYYHGGPTFLSESTSIDNVFAWYSGDRPAIVYGNYGKGKFLLSGVHFELQAPIYQQYVVKHTPNASEYKQEQAICEQLAQMNSKSIWDKIQRLLNEIAIKCDIPNKTQA
ncbi:MULTISPECIES: BPL-N domain-containing protein [Glaesserella]|uniref:Biotin--protein ligase n=1 Tax=Glaesserella australis TaxID=2094024 RepID=A0A328BZ00_9PAST|nr:MULTISPECIES: BPL-N domain-containing protein [Glaesserella]AUI67042.1 biotin--protein ligase [Glaesserella sp. 15-184]RAL18865.1 biotin--protein ligase [Glaesserella australis]